MVQNDMQVKAMVMQCARELRAEGFPVRPIVDVALMRGFRTLGRCVTHVLSGTVEIKISRGLIGDDDALLNTVLHELCHAMEGAKGHGAVWQAYARRVSEMYDLKTPIASTASDEECENARKRLGVKKRVVATVHCCVCGANFEYSRVGKVVKLMMLGQQGQLRCPCGAKGMFSLAC